MLPIHLYNTLGRTLQEFTPRQAGKVGIYTCGPTVYDRASIGNLRAYVFADVLRRIFEANGYAVMQVINITDVGHLTDDASEGDDKMELASNKTGKTAWEVAAMYTDLFTADLRKLNILTPTVMPKATDHIAEQIAMIEDIEKAGYTYQISDGVYFDTAKLASYGQLSGQKLADKEAGARIEENLEKHQAADFALWKLSEPQRTHPELVEGSTPKRHMEWESPWGKGFPGWHIECSAMSEKYLGIPFDIHTGGVDHIAVHHENEIAQAEAARGVIEADIWMHNEFLLIDGGKMSKSLGNTYSLDDLFDKGISPLAFRYFVLGAHYKTQLNFTWESVQAAENALNRLIDTVRDWDKPTEANQELVTEFLTLVNKDLDTVSALALLWKVVGDDALETSVKAATILAFDEVLGLALEDVVARPIKIPAEVQALLKEREQARANKDFAASDALRDAMALLGYAVEDTAAGQHVREAR